MNRAYWKGVLERRDNIVRYTQDFGNITKHSFNTQLSQYYDEYYNANHYKIEKIILKEIFMHHDMKFTSNVSTDNCETAEFWKEIYKERFANLTNLNLQDIADVDFGSLINVRAENVVKKLIDGQSMNEIKSIFDFMIESNFIKSKVNPGLLIITIAPDELKPKLDIIVPRMSNQRHWFVVAKYFMKKHFVLEGDFRGAVDLIMEAYNGNPPISIDAKDLSRLNVDIFAKDVDLWYGANSPAKTNRDKQYCEIIKYCQLAFS